MADIKLKAQLRSELGKNKVNKIRREGNVPGILYHRKEDNVALTVGHRDLELVYRDAGTSTIIDIVIDGKDHPAIIKDVQQHPYRDEFLHCDLQTIRMDEVIALTVPITLEGRDEVRLQPSVLTQVLAELEIECLPGDIPEEISIDVRDMDFETPIFVEDLAIFSDEKITVHAEADDVVAILSEPEEYVEEEIVEVDAADVPTIDETEDDEMAEEVEETEEAEETEEE